jgi:hypothetical protein
MARSKRARRPYHLSSTGGAAPSARWETIPIAIGLNKLGAFYGKTKKPDGKRFIKVATRKKDDFRLFSGDD